MSEIRDQIEPGRRVRVIQQMLLEGTRTWTTTIEGEVVSFGQAKTGSWYAHAKDDRLWLDRLVLRRDDGEIVNCNLDALSRVELVEPPPAA